MAGAGGLWGFPTLWTHNRGPVCWLIISTCTLWQWSKNKLNALSKQKHSAYKSASGPSESLRAIDAVQQGHMLGQGVTEQSKDMTHCNSGKSELPLSGRWPSWEIVLIVCLTFQQFGRQPAVHNMPGRVRLSCYTRRGLKYVHPQKEVNLFWIHYDL